DEAVHVRRYVLPDASPAVRLRRQRHAVDERGRPRGGLGQHEAIRRDGRCGQVARVDGVRARYQRQRQARRLRRPGPAARPHHGSFSRSKCKGPLNGTKATGDHCPEGWAFYQYPGPGFQGIGDNSAESSYYTWVDQHNTFGLGEDVPMSTANLNDGLVALKDGKMILLRVPYPLGFYAKGFDGRIDDPSAGWKGRGLWTTSGDRAPWLMEGGKGSKPM